MREFGISRKAGYKVFNRHFCFALPPLLTPSDRSGGSTLALQPILLEQTIDPAAAVMPISRNDNSVNAIASQHGPHNDGA
jgi:hypothetical protein